MVERFVDVKTTTLNSAGAGNATITCPSGVIRTIELLSVSTTGVNAPGIPQPVATVYFDSQPNQNNFLESTFFGSGDSSDSRYTLHGGEAICVEWTGGTAAAQATVRIRGTQQTVSV